MLVEPSPEVVRLPVPSGVRVPLSTESDPRFDVVQTLHSSALHPAVVAVDALLVATVVVFSGIPLAESAAAASAFVAAGAIGRLYARRSTLETQGLTWYLRLLPLPLLALTCALAANGHVTAPPLVVPVATIAVVLVLLRAMAWLLVGSRRRQRRSLQSVLLVGPSARTFHPSSRSATASGFAGMSNASRTSYFASTSFQSGRSSTASRYSVRTTGKYGNRRPSTNTLRSGTR